MRKSIIISSVAVFIFVGIIACIFFIPKGDKPPADETEPTKSLDFIPAEVANNNITLPCLTGIYLKSNQLKQMVDFSNPDNNPCFFVISLYLSDDTLIYKSDYIAPGEHLADITLLQELQKGIYKNCRMVYNCYSLDSKTALNGGECHLEINSK